MRTIISGVYGFTNTTNGHRYVGSSKDVLGRKANHLVILKRKRHHSRHFQHAWDKYGEENFTFEILNTIEPFDRHRRADKVYVNAFKVALLSMEQHYIDLFRPEYNISPIAGSNLGVIFSDEAREKIRRAGLGREISDDTKEKLRQANLGKHHTNEAKEKVRQNSQAMWDAHPEYRQQASQRQSDAMTPERRARPSAR